MGSKYIYRYDLMNIKPIYRLVKSRAFQYIFILPNYILFLVILLSLFIGPQVGVRNFGLLLVWIGWWPLLLLILTPIGGRIWCMMCPMPALGEWIQRRAFISVNKSRFKAGLIWPHRLENIWIQNISLLAISIFISVLTTRPWATGIMLLLIGLILPLLFHLVFRGRVWCRYVCPVSGFIGIYSMVSMLELRARDRELCLMHMGNECYRGSDDGYPCPWFEFPQNMNRNTYCGLCMECVKTCPLDNIGLYLRVGGSDIYVDPGHGARRRGLDEPFKSFIMAGLSLIYTYVFINGDPIVKGISNILGGEAGRGIYVDNIILEGIQLDRLILFTGLLIFTCMILIPGIHLLAVMAVRWLTGVGREYSLRHLYILYSHIFIPLSLSGWMILSIYLLTSFGGYLINAAMDPFGLGWVTPVTDYTYLIDPGLLPYIFSVIIILGLTWAINVSWNISKRLFQDRFYALMASIPLLFIILGYMMLLTGLWMGAI